MHGIIRRSSSFNTQRIDHLYQDPHVNGVKLFLDYGDVADAAEFAALVVDDTDQVTGIDDALKAHRSRVPDA